MAKACMNSGYKKCGY